MLKNYTPAHMEENRFEEIQYPGYSFELENGNPVLNTEAAKTSWEHCQVAFPDGGRRKVYRNRYKVPARGICRCGCEVTLYGGYYGTTECDRCGQWYNSCGEEILPPEMWEEDLEEWD